jgi:hypothetical protein
MRSPKTPSKCFLKIRPENLSLSQKISKKKAGRCVAFFSSSSSPLVRTQHTTTRSVGPFEAVRLEVVRLVPPLLADNAIQQAARRTKHQGARSKDPMPQRPTPNAQIPQTTRPIDSAIFIMPRAKPFGVPAVGRCILPMVVNPPWPDR